MIVCPNCAKENQDHYKFCLGCGSDLPRGEQAEKARSTPTPPTGIPAMSDKGAAKKPAASPAPAAAAEPKRGAAKAAPAPEPEPEPAPKPAAAPAGAKKAAQTAQAAQPAKRDGGDIICASCGAKVLPGFAFCGACGTPVAGAKAAAKSPARAPEPAAGKARLVLIKPDGSEGGHVEIPDTEVAVGRDAGGFFATDPFLSPTHAILRTGEYEVFVRDANSLNGIFVKIPANEAVEIRSGDIFRMGQELILFEEIDRGGTAPDGTEKMGSPIEGLWGRIALIVGRGRLGNAFPVGGEGIALGRERGNILFPEDGYVSGLHLKIHTEKNRFYLTDLGSSNGTFLKLTDEGAFGAGSYLLMGQQLFRIELES